MHVPLNPSNESINVASLRKKHLPTLKNVIVALPQVEFVLLVTKAMAGHGGPDLSGEQQRLGRPMFA